jgi:hypothetical protein
VELQQAEWAEILVCWLVLAIKEVALCRLLLATATCLPLMRVLCLYQQGMVELAATCPFLLVTQHAEAVEAFC